MSENFTVFAEYIKDMSSETPSIDTYLHVKDIITKYNLNIFNLYTIYILKLHLMKNFIYLPNKKMSMK